VAVKFIKIQSQHGQAVAAIEEKARVPKSIKTIIRKQPYKGGLCYRQKHKAGGETR
jgi:hypothetical protein